jgi:signal transduction histidine kinase
MGMRERAQAFGGSVDMSGGPNVGTTVCVRIPVDRESVTEPS